MIGKFCMGFQHLFKSAETKSSNIGLLICHNEFRMLYYKILTNGNLVLINNRASRNSDCVNDEVISFMEATDRNGTVVILRKNSSTDKQWFNQAYMGGGHVFLMFPTDFQESFESFINANKKQYSNLQSKYGSVRKNEYFFYSICNNSMNFFSWLLKNYYEYEVNPQMLYFIMRWNEKYPKLSSKLSKGTITAYKNNSNIFKLVTEIINVTQDKRINDSISQFNTAQKHMLQSLPKDCDERKILSQFFRLSDVQKKNFIQKVSSIESLEELIHQLRLVCETHFLWNKESFFEYLNNTKHLDYSIIYDNNNCVVVRVNDYETVRRLAKTTNWCISKEKSYWNQYMSNGYSIQYVLFDFNEKIDSEFSIIGITVQNNRIEHSHSFVNKNLVHRREYNYFPLPTFGNDSENENVYSILKSKQIPLSIFETDCRKQFQFQWNKQSCLAHISKIKNGNYSIVKETDTTLVLKCNFKCLVGIANNKQLENIALTEHLCESIKDLYYLVLFNFDNEIQQEASFFIIQVIPNRPNVCRIGNIYGITYGCSILYSIIHQFDLPITIFTQEENKLLLLSQIMMNGDIKYASELIDSIDNFDYNNLERKDDYLVCMTDAFINTWYGRYSFALFDLVYEKGITLSTLLPKERIIYLLTEIVSTSRNHYRDRNISNEDYEAFANGTLFDMRKCVYIASIQLLNKIKEFEDNKLFIELAKYILNDRIWCDGLYDLIFETALDTFNSINTKTNSRMVVNIIKTAANHSKPNIIKKVLEKHPNSVILANIPMQYQIDDVNKN